MPQITVNGARHYYRLEGDLSLPPIVLVHPIGADLGMWDKVAPLLASRFCVLRYDLRGHGGTEATEGEYTLKMLSRDLRALTAGLQMEKFILCGVSLGGMTALRTALDTPASVRGVAVTSAAPKLNPPPGGWDERARHALAKGMDSLAGPMVERMFSESFRGTRDACVETTRNTFARMDPAGYASACAVLRDTDLTSELPQVSVPALVISGANDPLVTPQVGAEMAAAMPGARQVTLACGHFPPLEAAGEFAKVLEEFSVANP